MIIRDGQAMTTGKKPTKERGEEGSGLGREEKNDIRRMDVRGSDRQLARDLARGGDNWIFRERRENVSLASERGEHFLLGHENELQVWPT